MPISAGIACVLSLGNKVIQKIVLNKHIKYKKQNEKNQKTTKLFDKLYRKSVQDNFFDKSEYEIPFEFFTEFLDGTENESLL